MRQVKFKRWIPIQFEKKEGHSIKTKVDGTGCFESEFCHDGIFHEWGIESEEFENGVGNDTYAIVELPDGTIEKVTPSAIKFVD